MARTVSVLFFLSLFFSSASVAQDEKETVGTSYILVVPYNRFEFHTEFPLDELAQANDVPKSEVYDAFRGKLLNTLANYTCEHYQFRIINSANLDYLVRRVRYNLENKPNTYYASDLSLVPQPDLQRIMESYNADYILFVNWYQVKKSAYNSLDRKPFSQHLVDFDIYDVTKRKLLWEHKFKLEPDHSDISIARRGLGVADMTESFQKLADHICRELGIP